MRGLRRFHGCACSRSQNESPDEGKPAAYAQRANTTQPSL
jgi:hypothetical protein